MAWQSTYDPLSSFFQPVSLLTTKSIFKRTLFCWIFFFTAQKMKFSIKDFFTKCDEICRKLRIWPHLLKKTLIKNFIFCAAFWLRANIIEELTLLISKRKSQLCLFPSLRRKCPNTEFFWSVFNPTAGKYGTEKTPYLDTYFLIDNTGATFGKIIEFQQPSISFVIDTSQTKELWITWQNNDILLSADDLKTFHNNDNGTSFTQYIYSDKGFLLLISADISIWFCCILLILLFFFLITYWQEKMMCIYGQIIHFSPSLTTLVLLYVPNF